MMYNFKILWVSIAIVTCFVACKKSDSAARETEKVNTNSAVQEKESSFSEEFITNDKDHALEFLKHNKVIGDEYPNSSILYFQLYKLSNFSYNLIKLDYDKRIGDNFKADPVINVLYITKNNKLLSWKDVYSINDDDFEFKFKKGNNYFFEYYDSATGWKKIITFDVKSMKFYETHQYDFSETIDFQSVDLESKKYNLKENSKVYEFKEML